MDFEDRKSRLKKQGFDDEVIDSMVGDAYKSPTFQSLVDEDIEAPSDLEIPAEIETASALDDYDKFTTPSKDISADDDTDEDSLMLNTELEEAQGKRADQLQLLNMLGGANTIAEGIASGYGGKAPAPDLSSLRAAAKLPVEEITERQKTESADRKAQLEKYKLTDAKNFRDPDTPVSKFYRLMAGKRGIPVTDDMSAKDLEPILKATQSTGTYRHMTVKNQETGELETVLYNAKDPSDTIKMKGVVAREARAEEELPSKIEARKATTAQKEQQTKKVSLQVQEAEELNDPKLAKVLQLQLKRRNIDAEGLSANQMRALLKGSTSGARYQRIPMQNENGEVVVGYVNLADPTDKIETDIIDVAETRRREDLELKKEGEQRRQEQFAFKKDEADKDRATKVVDTFNKDKTVQAALQGFVAADKAEKFVQEGGKMAPAVMGRLLARMAGEVGVMTDADVAAFRGSQMYKDALSRYFTKTMLSGELTETDKEAMRNMIRIMKQTEMQHYQSRANVISGEFAAVNQVPQEEIMVYLQPALDEYLKPKETVRVRRKSDGAVKMLPADVAEKYLKDPTKFERVQ